LSQTSAAKRRPRVPRVGTLSGPWRPNF
jgi:hypothetical protein